MVDTSPRCFTEDRRIIEDFAATNRLVVSALTRNIVGKTVSLLFGRHQSSKIAHVGGIEQTFEFAYGSIPGWVGPWRGERPSGRSSRGLNCDQGTFSAMKPALPVTSRNLRGCGTDVMTWRLASLTCTNYDPRGAWAQVQVPDIQIVFPCFHNLLRQMPGQLSVRCLEVLTTRNLGRKLTSRKRR